MISSVNCGVICVWLSIMFFIPCESIKCFSCNSANNSACLDKNIHKMHEVLPIVDCGKALPSVLSDAFFCRKMVQVVLDQQQLTPEVRVMRGCGWVKSKKDCYKANNADHLETACQCFEDMCNAAKSLTDERLLVSGVVAVFFVMYWSWRNNL